MKLMTPREYGRLLYESFFKAITLTVKTWKWSRKQQILTILQAGMYNLCISLITVFTILFCTKLLSLVFSFNFELSYLYVVGGVVVGVVGGVVVGGGVSGVGVFGVVVGFVGVGGVVIGVGGGVNISILSAIAIIVLSEFFYFLFIGRLFYYPFYIPGLVKKINLHKLPFHWDENIALPIPFLPRILEKQAACNNKNEAVKEAVDLIRTRPVHRKDAQKGLIRIALNEMQSFRTLESIARLEQELSFLPLDDGGFSQGFSQGFRKPLFTGDFIQFFQGIRKLEHDAQIAHQEQNPASKLRKVRHLYKRIDEFRKQLDFSQTRYSARFSKVIARWHSIVEREISDLEQQKGKPLPNPFITGKPILQRESEIFVGRKDIIAEIEREVLKTGSPGALLFLGNRRTGKTSTLLNMGPFLVSGIIPVFVDFHDPTINSSERDFAQELSGRILEALKRPGQSAKPCTSLAGLSRFINTLDPLLEKDDQYILLCFDEYERLPGHKNELIRLPDTFRYLVQHCRRIICLFAGSHGFHEIRAINWSDYLINVRVIRISFLDHDAALHLVTAPVAGYDIVYKPADLAYTLVSRLGRQPYLIQATMFELTEILNNKNSKTATSEDIDAAVGTMFDAADAYFSYFWESELDREEREIVTALAHNKPVSGYSGATLKSLVRKEVVCKKDSTYTFCIPVVKEWIVEHT